MNLNIEKILTLGVFDYRLVRDLVSFNIYEKLNSQEKETEFFESEIELPSISSQLTNQKRGGPPITSTSSAEEFQRCMAGCQDSINPPNIPNVGCCPAGIFPPPIQDYDPGEMPIQNGDDCQCGKQQSFFNSCKQSKIEACEQAGATCSYEQLSQAIQECYWAAFWRWSDAVQQAFCCDRVVMKYRNCARRCQNRARGKGGKFPGYEHPFFEPLNTDTR